MSENALKILSEGGSIPRPITEGPLSAEQVVDNLIGQGFHGTPSVANPYIADGIYIHPEIAAACTEDQLQQLLMGVLAGAHNVKDSHMPMYSVVECGFIRAIAIHAPRSPEVDLTVFCRFTIDTCPFGLVLTKGIKDNISEQTGISPERIAVVHGGTPWVIDTAPEAVQNTLRQFLKCIPAS